MIDLEPSDLHWSSCAVWSTPDGSCNCSAWRSAAACRDVDPSVFFPERATSPSTALKLCADCPVFDQCRAYVDTIEAGLPADKFCGVWAGETASARLRRRGRA